MSIASDHPEVVALVERTLEYYLRSQSNLHLHEQQFPYAAKKDREMYARVIPELERFLVEARKE